MVLRRELGAQLHSAGILEIDEASLKFWFATARRFFLDGISLFVTQSFPIFTIFTLDVTRMT